MNQTNILEQFWALTANGVWEVLVKRHSLTIPIVRLIKSRISRDGEIGVGSMLEGGSLVAVMPEFIGLYFPGHLMYPRRKSSDTGFPISVRTPDDISDDDFGDKTGRAYGYFIRLQDALAANERSDLAHAIGFYEDETKETLRSIGPNHPVFIVSRGTPFAFPIWYYREAGIDPTKAPRFDRKLLDFGKEMDKGIVDSKKTESLVTNEASDSPEPEESVAIKTSEAPPEKVRQIQDGVFMTPFELKSAVEKFSSTTAPIVKEKRKYTRRCDPEKAAVTVREIESASSGSLTTLPRSLPFTLDGREVRPFVLQKGIYEVEEVKYPPAGGGAYEPWYIIKSLRPRIIGNAIQFWSHWFKTEGEYAVRLSRIGSRILLQIFRDRPVKEIL